MKVYSKYNIYYYIIFTIEMKESTVSEDSKVSKKSTGKANGKTKSNKRILREYQSRYLNEKREKREPGSTLLNSD